MDPVTDLDRGGYVERFGQSPSVLATVAVVALVTLVVTAAAPRRRVPVALTGFSLAGVLGTTLVPTGGWSRFGVESGALRSIAQNLRPHLTDLTSWVHADDGPLNVLLFVPLGLSLSLLLRRPVPAVVAGVVLSLGIECYQAALTTRVGSPADVVANGLGTAVGAALAVPLLLAGPAVRRVRRRRRGAAAGTARGLRT